MWRNAARASRYQGHVVSRPTCLAPTRALPLSASARLRARQPTTMLEKAFLAGTSAAQALADPRNARAVGVVGETTGYLALRRMQQRMERHPIGRCSSAASVLALALASASEAKRVSFSASASAASRASSTAVAGPCCTTGR